MGSQDVKSQDGQKALRHCNETLVRRYLRANREGEDGEKGSEGEGFGLEGAESEELPLDVDATIIEAGKGDGETAYDGTVGYHPMLGFSSDGRRKPCCSHVQFRPGNASAQVGIKEAITHTLELVAEERGSLGYFRSDSAGCQPDVVDLLDEKNVGCTITAGIDEAVRGHSFGS